MIKRKKNGREIEEKQGVKKEGCETRDQDVFYFIIFFQLTPKERKTNENPDGGNERKLVGKEIRYGKLMRVKT